MTKSKKSNNIAAIPLVCDECGRSKPLYILLITYKTDKDSEDYHNGMKEIEVGCDDGHYCKRCLDKMVI